MSALDILYNLDENKEKCCGVSTDFIRKLTDLFLITIDEKSSTNILLSKMYCLRKSSTLKFLYGPIYLELNDYHTYSDTRSVIFLTHINRNLICSPGYINCVRCTDLIIWVSNNYWEFLLSEFSYAKRISACPRTIIYNKCEQNNIIGEILNAGDNVDDQEDSGFTGSYSKIAPTNIDDYTKNKFLNMQQESLRPQRDKENNDRQTD